MSELLAAFLSRADAPSPCIVDALGIHSHSAVIDRARRVATSLLESSGVPSLDGARVAVLAPPGASFVAALFGIMLAGGCAIVLSPLHPAPETRYFCEDAGTRAVLVSRAHASQVAHLRDAFDVRSLEPMLDEPGPSAVSRSAPSLPAIDDSSPALQLYTSGTTGKPKGAVITHRNLSVQQRLVGQAWGFRPEDVLLHALPLHHMHGLAIALFTALGAGATTRMTTFDARTIWEAMADATVFMGVPAMYHRLFATFDAADDATRRRWTANAAALRLATSGSAALPVTLAERWRALTGNIPLERFGMTEIGVGISNPLAGERVPGCVGFPLPTVEARIVGEDGSDAPEGSPGELLIRGPSVFAGYHARPDETAKAFVTDPGGGPGWFRTGDTVVRDQSLPGAPYRILGRTSVDILKSGGYKLSALEIEEVLREHPGIGEVAVVGIADEAWGDRVVACVVRRAGEAPAGCDAGSLRAFAKERLATYKVPKDFIFLDELPKNALGKVVKPDLARAVASRSRARDEA